MTLLSDKEFLDQFENLTLDPAQFNHYGHIRLAWLYLTQHPLDEAIIKVTRGIQAFATSQDATDKFRHTLTEAIVRIMSARMQTSSNDSLDEFLSINRDLTDNMMQVVGKHYSGEILDSEPAKTGFVEPDLAPFPKAA